jgi:hypothetical protein
MNTCEICGCDELHACPGGCAWDSRFLLAGRLVCTRCTGLLDAMQGLGIPPEPYVLNLSTAEVVEACLS